MEKFGWLGFFIVVYQKKLPTKGILFNEKNPPVKITTYYNCITIQILQVNQVMVVR